MVIGAPFISYSARYGAPPQSVASFDYRPSYVYSPVTRFAPNSGVNSLTINRQFPGTLIHSSPQKDASTLSWLSREWPHHAGLGALAYITGLLLRPLPAINRPSLGAGKMGLPSDWKIWAKIGLGITAVNQLNQVFNWHPPPWLMGLETVTVLHPLTSGVSKNSLMQLALLAPLVAGLVTLADRANRWIEAEHQQNPFPVPPWALKLGLSLAIGLTGAWAFPKLYKPLLASGWFGKINAKQVSQSVMAGAVTCARGCTPGGVVCLSEMSELMGGVLSNNDLESPLSRVSSDKRRP